MMKFFINNLVQRILALSLVVLSCSFAEAPKDAPMQVTDRTKDVFSPYVEMAQRTFPDVKKNFEAGVYQKQGRQLQVQVKLTDKEGQSEVPFVNVIGSSGKSFRGIITNQIESIKGYALGDTISFMQGEIMNWVVLDSEGNEEGNFVGKAIDAYQYKMVGLFFEVTYSKGEFKLTYQQAIVGNNINVDGIISPEVIEQAKKLLKQVFIKKMAKGVTFAQDKPFYTYHVYDFVNKKFAE